MRRPPYKDQGLSYGRTVALDVLHPYKINYCSDRVFYYAMTGTLSRFGSAVPAIGTGIEQRTPSAGGVRARLARLVTD